MERLHPVDGKLAAEVAVPSLGSSAVVIPPLYCPFPSTSGRKDAAEIHAASMAWAERQGLLANAAERKFADGNRIAWGLGLAHPHASAESFQLLTDWLLHFCLFDTYVEEHLRGLALARVCARFMDVLRGEELVGGDMPFVRAIADIRQRLLKLADEELVSRFADTLERCFEVYLYEDSVARLGVQPHVESHLELKTRTGGFYSWWVLMEVVEGVRLAPDTRELPLVRSTLHLAAEAAELANDLFTLRREMDQGTTNNLVLRLDLPLPQAIARVASLHDATIASLVAHIEQLSSLQRYQPHLEQWFLLVGRTLSAHMTWAQKSQRALGWPAGPQQRSVA